MRDRDPYGEKRAAHRKGGRTQLNSGRHWTQKGDYTAGQELFDRKETEKKSYSIKLDYWQLLTMQAGKIGRNPALEVCFKDADGTEITVTVIPEYRYRELIDLEKETQGTSSQTKGSSLGKRGNLTPEEIHSVYAFLKEKPVGRDVRKKE